MLTLVLLLGAGIGADAWVTQRAEAAASEHVAALLDAEQAQVRLHGWPASLRLVSGRIPELEVQARDARLAERDVEIAVLEMRLTDVRLDFAALDEGFVRLHGADGTFTADLAEDAVAGLAGVDVRLGDGLGQVVLDEQVVEVVASVEQGVVVLRPVGAAPEEASPMALPLPRLPGGAVVEAAQIVSGALRVSGLVTSLDGP